MKEYSAKKILSSPIPKLKSCILEQRTKRGMTQRQLADALDTTENTIIAWEKELPDWMFRVIVLCELYNCSPDELEKTLDEKRKSIGVSQRQLAKFLGMTKNTYSNWERGGLQKSRYIPKLKQLYQALNCSSLEDLYDEST